MSDEMSETTLEELWPAHPERFPDSSLRAIVETYAARKVAEERERCVGIVTALWGADLVTTQAALEGKITLDRAVREAAHAAEWVSRGLDGGNFSDQPDENP